MRDVNNTIDAAAAVSGLAEGAVAGGIRYGIKQCSDDLVENAGRRLEFKNGYIQIGNDGLKMSQRYYDKLWKNGRFRKTL